MWVHNRHLLSVNILITVFTNILHLFRQLCTINIIHVLKCVGKFPFHDANDAVNIFCYENTKILYFIKISETNFYR